MLGLRTAAVVGQSRTQLGASSLCGLHTSLKFLNLLLSQSLLGGQDASVDPKGSKLVGQSGDAASFGSNATVQIVNATALSSGYGRLNTSVRL